MILIAITLDAYMTAREVLQRLARRGLWLDPDDPAAAEHIDSHVRLTGLDRGEIARRLRRDPKTHGIAIRRQWFATILWYSKPVEEVLVRCGNSAPDRPLVDVLNLHETDAEKPVPPPAPGVTPARSGVIVEDHVVLGVSHVEPPRRQAPLPPSMPSPAGASKDTEAAAGSAGDFGLGGMRGTGGVLVRETPLSTPASAPKSIEAWPRIDAPPYVPAGKEFDVVVGFAREQQAATSAGGPARIPVPAGSTSVDVTVQLVASGIDAPQGWSQTMKVDSLDPYNASVTFKLTGREPVGPEPVHLTRLEVRFVTNGEVCGTASRPIVILASAANSIPNESDPRNSTGAPWLAEPVTASASVMSPGGSPIDLTIEISKPDGNAARGTFVCQISSPHAEVMNTGPFPIDFSDDAASFAGNMIDRIRTYGNQSLVSTAMQSIGNDIARTLPDEVFDAIYVVAQKTAPDPPTVLFVSAEPYVPWDLTTLDPPLDATRPGYLGAQVILGRWIRDGRSAASARSPLPVGVGIPRRITRPPAMPPASIVVKDMAVMAAFYKGSGLAQLPHAEAEALALVKSHGALPLAATPQTLMQLLGATLERNFERIGGAAAIHFAGHGQYDAAVPNSSMMYLSDGTTISSSLFNAANYGTYMQPLIFLNACLIGNGGELLGNAGGFPGECLRGGFGGVLGALWEVDDAVAADVAREFWGRALPKDRSRAEPVAAVLRDLRAKYHADLTKLPVATYLSYVFYGHPRLTLQ